MGKSNRYLLIIKKLPSLSLGLFLYGLGIALTIKANLGLSPWGVFHMGLANNLPITFGQAAQLTGFVVLILTCFIKITPGLSSICNMYFVGLFIDLIINTNIIKTPQSFLLQFLMLALGLFIIGWASYFYLRVELGAGPRDGLMEGLVRLLKRPVWQIRTGIEITVLAIGFLLGGPVGIGTIIASLCTGTIVQFVFKLGKYSSEDAQHMDLLKMVKYLRNNTEQKAAM